MSRDSFDERWPTWLVVAAVLAGYVPGALLAFVWFGATSLVVLFLPAGVTSAALVLTHHRRWPWILVGVAAAEMVVDLSQGLDPSYVWGFALANTAEPLLGAFLLRRRVGRTVNLQRRADLLAYLACCVAAGPALGGVIGGTTTSVGMDRSWIDAFLAFSIGDALGVVTVGGSILAWRYRRTLNAAFTARWVVSAVAVVIVTVVGFWPLHLPLFYLPIPLLFWIAFNQGLTVTITSGLAMTITANLLSSAGHGPWASLDIAPQWNTLTLQLFLGITILGACFLAVGVAERDTAQSATSAERAARERLGALQTLTAKLATAPTSSAIVETIVRDGVGLLADHGMAGLLSPDGTELATFATTRIPDPVRDQDRDAPRSAATPLTVTARTGARVAAQTPVEIAGNFPDLAPTYEALGIRSGLCVPIFDAAGLPVGALAFGFARDNAIDTDVISLAETLANLTGQALRRAQLYERELDAAHQLQQALLPVLAGGLSGIHVGAEYRPADQTHEVGGDWYDVFNLPGGRIGFVVGDVVGHDLLAAAAMARLQAAVRIIAQSAHGPGEVLELLDQASAVITNSVMTTVGYADYDPATGRLRYACAGHPPPLLVTADGVDFLWEGRSQPVGVESAPRPEAECLVPVGTTMVWYTDGLVERRGLPMRAGLDRLAAVAAPLHDQQPETLCRELLQRMSGGVAMHDDTVVLCVRFIPDPVGSIATASRIAPVVVDNQGERGPVTSGADQDR